MKKSGAAVSSTAAGAKDDDGSDADLLARLGGSSTRAGARTAGTAGAIQPVPQRLSNKSDDGEAVRV